MFFCTGPVPDDVEIQTMVGEAINRLIKHHHKSLKERVRDSFSSFLTRGIFWIFFYVLYSTLLHLPPLRFRCVGGCWDRTQDCCDFGIGSQTL
jgi:hypothetical protein